MGGILTDKLGHSDRCRWKGVILTDMVGEEGVGHSDNQIDRTLFGLPTDPSLRFYIDGCIMLAYQENEYSHFILDDDTLL